MNELAQQVFSNELTEQGIKALEARFPASLVMDMADDEQFKAARKIRTERNKLNDAIKRRRIDVTKEIADAGKELSDRVDSIFAVVVDPFEVEDAKRKAEAERKAAALKQRLDAERQRINGFKGFIDDCRMQNSDQVSSAIDALTNIDCMEFHKDIVHEAVQVKEETLAVLGDMLTSKISLEAAEAQRKEAEAAQAVDREINAIRMIPMDYISSPSSDIKQEMNRLDSRVLTADVFGNRLDEAQQAINTSRFQLESMLQQAVVNEANKPAEQAVEAEAQAPESHRKGTKRAAHQPSEPESPTAAEIISVLAAHYGAKAGTVADWLCELNFSELDRAA